MEKLTKEKKLDFITRNGWVRDETQIMATKYRKKAWDEEAKRFIRNGWDVNQCRNYYSNYSLEDAYELEMEAEYDRVTELLKRAKKLILVAGAEGDEWEEGSMWIEDYERWSKI
jgi:hypothetical protein